MTRAAALVRAARASTGFLRRADLAPSGRDIPEDFPHDKKALKGLAQSLWQLSVALGHVMSAYSRLTKTRAVSISPDGQIGGKGYVMAVTDVREKLGSIIGTLSAITDSFHDEIHADHWQRDMSKDVKKIVDEVEEVREDPEAEADAEYAEEFGTPPDKSEEKD